MLDIIKTHKKILGLIIRFYRTNYYKKEYPNSWAINDFVKDKEEYICSPATLSAIENGKIIQDDDIYDKLLIKLGQKYNYKKDLSNLHKDFNEKIIQAFEDFNSELLDILINNYIQALSPYKNFILEKELISALNLRKKVLTSDMEEYINNYLELFQIYEPAVQILLSNIIYSYFYNYGSLKRLEEVSKILNLSNSEYLRIQCNHINTLIRKKYFFQATENLLKVSTKYIQKYNILGILTTYSIKLNLIAEMNSDEWKGEAKRVLPIFKENINKDKEKLITFIYNIAMGHLQREEYELAYDILIFILNESKKLFLPTAIYLNIIASIIDIDPPMEAFKPSYNKELYSDEFNIIYKFYLLKNNNTSPEKLENYIFKKIHPIFAYVSDDSLYYAFGIELEKCVDVTGHKNLLYRYNRIVRRSSR